MAKLKNGEIILISILLRAYRRGVPDRSSTNDVVQYRGPNENAWVGGMDSFGACCRNGLCWRNLRIQLKTAFSRFPPLHRADLEGRLRIDLAGSPSFGRMTGVCASVAFRYRLQSGATVSFVVAVDRRGSLLQRPPNRERVGKHRPGARASGYSPDSIAQRSSRERISPLLLASEITKRTCPWLEVSA
jgi:hypothetical protein